jgi:hypothetical protein
VDGQAQSISDPLLWRGVIANTTDRSPPWSARLRPSGIHLGPGMMPITAP